MIWHVLVNQIDSLIIETEDDDDWHQIGEFHLTVGSTHDNGTV